MKTINLIVFLISFVGFSQDIGRIVINTIDSTDIYSSSIYCSDSSKISYLELDSISANVVATYISDNSKPTGFHTISAPTGSHFTKILLSNGTVSADSYLDGQINYGSYIDLSWKGSNKSNYNFSISDTLPSTYNTINRKPGSSSFNMVIHSDQTFMSDESIVFSGDILTSNNSDHWFGLGLASDTSHSHSDLDFAVRGYKSGSNVFWMCWESGSNTGVIDTTINGDRTAWRIEYDGNNHIDYYINGDLIHQDTSTYSNDTLNLKLMGYASNSPVSDHLSLRPGPLQKSIVLPFGDSNTFGRAANGFKGSSYVYQMVDELNAFVNPVLGQNGYTTQNTIDNFLGMASTYYDAAYDHNIATIILGINDQISAVNADTTVSNLIEIVDSLKSVGFKVILCTIPPHLNHPEYVGRVAINDSIIADSLGADYIVDLTNTVMEWNSNYFECDKLHWDPFGMKIVSDAIREKILEIID